MLFADQVKHVPQLRQDGDIPNNYLGASFEDFCLEKAKEPPRCEDSIPALLILKTNICG